MNVQTDTLYPCCPRPDALYDVIVAGGGPAGIGAALAAASSGARTLILEARSQFGGTATAAMWMEINFLFKDNEDKGGYDTLLLNMHRTNADPRLALTVDDENWRQVVRDVRFRQALNMPSTARRSWTRCTLGRGR